MKRLIIMGAHIMPAAQLLFAGSDRYTPQQFARWPELEVTVQDDERYAVWVNLLDDAELLQDTKKDTGHIMEKLAPYVDEIIED